MSRFLSRLFVCAFSIMIVGATVAPAYADGAADIKERQALMKAIGGKMKAIGGILKGGDPSMLAAHTSELAALAKKAKSAFPAGSGPDAGETEALPVIWTDTAGFNKVLAEFVTTTEALAAAGATGDLKATGAAMGAVGKNACGACHQTFRKKKS